MVDALCLSESLLDGAKEVFETMIFMDIEKSSEADQTIDNEALLGTITFTGEIEGCVAIGCSAGCAKVIAANMLGSDDVDSIDEGEICDAIGEVTNMIMGSLKSRIQGNFSDLEVSIPSVICGRSLENNLGEGANKITIHVCIEDEYPAELSLLYRKKQK